MILNQSQPRLSRCKTQVPFRDYITYVYPVFALFLVTQKAVK